MHSAATLSKICMCEPIESTTSGLFADTQKERHCKGTTVYSRQCGCRDVDIPQRHIASVVDANIVLDNSTCDSQDHKTGKAPIMLSSHSLLGVVQVSKVRKQSRATLLFTQGWTFSQHAYLAL